MRAKGNLLGLRPTVLKQIDRLADRRVDADAWVDASLAVAIQDAALAAGRRLGVLVDRRGVVREVLVGGATTLDLPDRFRRRTGPGRLCGQRLVHVTLGGRGNSQEDLETLRLFSLDATVAVIAGEPGSVPRVEIAHLLPPNADGKLWEVLPRVHATAPTERFDLAIRDLEAQIRREAARLTARGANGWRARDAAIVVLPVFGRGRDPEWETAELKALCHTAGLAVVAVLQQQRKEPDPRFLIGQGKLRELTMLGLQKGVDLMVFGAPLTPSQQHAIAQETGVRVIDRNQLILDIFASHAHTNQGRIEVELAQLRYNLPRLSEKDDSLSRLTGGIGAQGPGETTLEMERRRARDRIRFLEERARALAEDRAERRRRRVEADLPLAALVGYTNAGKSTLFNTLTGADVTAQDRLFATLDPTVRRARLPGGQEILVVDTVGFIRDLPEELVGAFRATLEEAGTARVLVQVADASDPHVEEQVASVQAILRDFGLGDKAWVLALNKADRVADRGGLAVLAATLGGVPVAAVDRETLGGLLREIEVRV